MDVEFNNIGNIYVNNNTISNCSSHKSQFLIDSDDHVVANANTFTGWTVYQHGFLSLQKSPSVEVDGLVITGASQGDSNTFGSLINIGKFTKYK